MLLSFSFNVKFLKFLDHPIEITGIIRKTGRHVKNSVWTLRHKCLRLFWSNKWTRCILLHDKSEFYGMTLVPFQSKPTQQKNLLKLSLRTSFKHTPPVAKRNFSETWPTKWIFPTYEQEECPLIDLSGYCKLDDLWSFCQVIKDKDICPLPTWNAFNSLITPVPNISICQGLPLYAGVLVGILKT